MRKNNMINTNDTIEMMEAAMILSCDLAAANGTLKDMSVDINEENHYETDTDFGGYSHYNEKRRHSRRRKRTVRKQMRRYSDDRHIAGNMAPYILNDVNPGHYKKNTVKLKDEHLDRYYFLNQKPIATRKLELFAKEDFSDYRKHDITDYYLVCSSYMDDTDYSLVGNKGELVKFLSKEYNLKESDFVADNGWFKHDFTEDTFVHFRRLFGDELNLFSNNTISDEVISLI